MGPHPGDGRFPGIPPTDPFHVLEDASSVSTPVAPHFPAIIPTLSLMAGKKTGLIPGTGIPVLVLHGPFPVRAALGITADDLVVRPLPPLVPSLRLRREDIASIDVEDGHWYAFGRLVVCVRRVKGPSLRLMSPPIGGVPDGGETLGRLLRAWWRARANR